MGTRGPVPAREEERRRANAPAHPILKLGAEEMAALPFPIDLAPEPPKLEELQAEVAEEIDYDKPDRSGKWHPYVRELHERLQRDPSRVWNGPAAMALDLVMLENLDRLLKPRVAKVVPVEDGDPYVIYDAVAMTGAEMAAVLKWASARGLYEADRLRIQKEITFYSEPENRSEAAVLSLVQDRDAFAG